MAISKYNKTSDAIADLYRAAFYLAKHSEKIGISFILKAKLKLGKKMTINMKGIKANSYWAEKVLDEYKKLKMSLSSN